MLIALAGGVVVVVALAVGGWFWYSAVQSRTLAAYAEALSRLRAVQGPQTKPEDRAAAAREVEAILARYPSSSAAPQAAYELASLKYDAGDYQAARRAYEVVLAGGASGTLRTLARAGVGYAWEAEREYAKAIEAYRVALDGLGSKEFYYETLLSDLGRSQELAGKRTEAASTYTRLIKEFPQGKRVDDIRLRLARLGAS